jgi:glyoxylase-like metal-dependent hydrolase (beta-lactamase superfamily II)
MAHRFWRTALALAWLTAPALAQNTAPQTGATPFGAAKGEMTKLAEDVYTFSFAGTRTLVVTTADGVIVGDPISVKAAPLLQAEIRKLTDKPVKYLIYSHSHWDHALGGKVFKDAGATVVSQRNCLESFYRYPHKDLVLPDASYDQHMEITLGGRTVRLLYLGLNHGDCMTFLHVPHARLLHIVDLVTPGSVPVGTGKMEDTYLLDTIRTLKDIEAMDFDVMVGGHGAPSAPKAAVTERRAYMEALMTAVRAEIDKGTPFGQIPGAVALPQFKHLNGYDRFLRHNAERVLIYNTIGW